MRRVVLLAALAAAVLSAPSRASADFLQYVAVLNGANESPPNASLGTGTGFVDVDTVAHTMRVRIFFAGLTGTTTASHIHGATPTPLTGTAGVATTTPNFAGFPLGVTSGSYDATLDLTALGSYNPAFVTANGGTASTAEVALLGAIAAGRSYLNIHSTFAPGGEIRGFLVPVPEPSSLALIGMGALGMGAVAVRRQRRGRTA